MDSRPLPAPAAGPDDPDWPADAVEVGRILGAWGIKGWIKVTPLSKDPQALFSSKRWFLAPPDPVFVRPAGGIAAWPSLLRITQAREQGDWVVAAVQGVAERDQAERLKGGRIFISRASFPTPEDNEYYWVDLIGLEVRNREDLLLGTVVGLIDTGPHSVLRITPPSAREGDANTECLVPFVDAYVDHVDLPGRRIQVDWQPDY